MPSEIERVKRNSPLDTMYSLLFLSPSWMTLSPPWKGSWTRASLSNLKSLRVRTLSKSISASTWTMCSLVDCSLTSLTSLLNSSDLRL